MEKSHKPSAPVDKSKCKVVYDANGKKIYIHPDDQTVDERVNSKESKYNRLYNSKDKDARERYYARRRGDYHYNKLNRDYLNTLSREPFNGGGGQTNKNVVQDL